MQTLLLLSSLLLAQSGAGGGVQARNQPAIVIPEGAEVSKLTKPQRTLLHNDLAAREQEPLPYLIDKFTKHDIVMLGEVHQVRQTCAFIAGSLAPLYEKAGLRCLATEFLRSRNTDKANEILQAKTWDRDAMIALMRDNPWPTWGFQGYLAIYEAVWTLNSSLEEDEYKLQVCGMDSNWHQYDFFFGKMEKTERFKSLLARESNMFNSLAKGPVARKERVLIHVGLAHTPTDQGLKLGTRLRRAYGDRVAQVVMHHQLGTSRSPSKLTQLIEIMSGSIRKGPMGFDIKGTPWARLRESSLRQFQGNPRGNLGWMFEGYILLTPVSEAESCRWIPGFIDLATFDKAEAIAVRMGWVEKDSCHTAKELDAALVKHFGK